MAGGDFSPANLEGKTLHAYRPRRFFRKFLKSLLVLRRWVPQSGYRFARTQRS